MTRIELVDDVLEALDSMTTVKEIADYLEELRDSFVYEEETDEDNNYTDRE